MSLRDQVNTALKEAMKARDSTRLSTLRLISAAIKDRDIAARSESGSTGVGDAEIRAILSRMVKQRNESAQAYEDGGRLELAEKERQEIGVIGGFLPRQLSDAEITAAIKAAMSETGASGLRDMGRVMGVLKEKYTGQVDFGAVGPMVKDMLAG